jgi:anti-sigma regulatory factor (Ser/Thr protein kinase)
MLHRLELFHRRFSKTDRFSSEIIREMQSAITEVCSQVVEQAYQKAIYESYNVLISPSSTQLEIKIADYGNPIPQNDPRFFGRAKKVMDDFEHKQHPKGGNVVTMVKKL